MRGARSGQGYPRPPGRCAILGSASRNVAVVRELIRSFPEDIVGARSDQSARERAARAFAECAHPDIETAMVAPDGWTAESSGVDGFIGSFGEWTEGTESAAVFFFVDSLIERVEFHLDRGRALRAAGID
jgi:hypothetical protein